MSARLRSYVALGDSFTAGTGCEPGDCWADRLAATLAAGRPDFLYRNLAREGAPSDELAAQVAQAIGLGADLVTVIAGANDVLRTTRPRPEATARNLAAAFDSLEEALPGVVTLTATVPEHWAFVPMGPRTRARVTAGIVEVNAAIRALAAERGIPCLEVAGHSELAEPSNFCEDGLHPSPSGHAKAAVAFKDLLERAPNPNELAVKA
jgi:lysophospholipase L1-like esterase